MIYGKFKSNNKCFPPGFDEEVAKEQVWLSMVMKKKVDNRSPGAQDLARMHYRVSKTRTLRAWRLQNVALQ